jgi:hypothetical protein
LKRSSVVLCSLFLAACVTQPHRAYPPEPGYAIDGVKVGDRVDVFLTDNTRHRLVVTRVDRFGLHGTDTSFFYQDMQAVVVLGKYPPKYLPPISFYNF